MREAALRKVFRRFFNFGMTRKTMLRLAHILETEKLKAQNWDNCAAENNGELWLLEKVAGHCKIVCDVGANAGEWTSAVIKLNPRVQVFAFEASPRTAKIFEKNLKHVPNVTLFNYGLAEKDATLILHDYGEGSGLTSFVSRQGSVGIAPESTYEVKCVRLDSVAELQGQTIDFLKIDTEGFEVPVLRGAKGILAQNKIKLLQFEYGGTWIDSRHLFLDAFEMLTQSQMNVGRLLPNGVEWIHAYDPNIIETFRYANFIACNAEMAALLKGSSQT